MLRRETAVAFRVLSKELSLGQSLNQAEQPERAGMLAGLGRVRNASVRLLRHCERGWPESRDLFRWRGECGARGGAGPGDGARGWSSGAKEDSLGGRRSKLLYRAKQRGFLELDLLVGLWAERHVPHMSEGDLKHMEQLLDEENPDLWKWLTSQLPAPERVASNPVFATLKASVDKDMQEYVDQGTAAPQGSEWVRGWDDSWRNQSAGKAS